MISLTNHRLWAPISTALGLILTTACGDNSLAGPDAAADAAPLVGQGSEPTSELIITEVSPRGEGPDWIELRNRGEAPIDLCDYFLTDSVDRLDHFLPLGGAALPDPCEPSLLTAGEFRIVYADDDVQSGSDHAPFKLGEADEVHVVDLSGRAVDSLVYLFSESGGTQLDRTLARVPTNTGLFFPALASQGAVNPEELP